jgi:hypothetical protein
VLGLDIGTIIQLILYALFAVLTAIISAVIGPTYDQLLVPELSPAALYPPLTTHAASTSNYLVAASQFSTYTLVNVVDPAIALVAVGVAVLYLARAFVDRWAHALDDLLPRLVLAVVAANFTIPITGAMLSLGGGVYPVFADWDGGSWQHWVNLAGYGQLLYSWDNGALALVLSLVEFALVLGLVLAVGLRDALLAVLIVLLPLFTLVWPFRPLAPLARRAWLLFGELVFLPCVIVVPLELAVNSPSAVLLVGYLACALASPFLLSLAGTHLSAFGFPMGGSAITSGTQRGLSLTSASVGGPTSSASAAVRGSGPVGPAISSTARAAGTAAAPAAAPLAVAQLVGHGAAHLIRHIQQPAQQPSRKDWRPVRGNEGG